MSTRYFFAASVVALTILAKISQGFLASDPQIVRHVPTEQKVIALTFDDGPNPKTTPAVLKVLKDKNVQATFFVLGENAKEYPALVAKIVQNGNEVGTHAYTHRHLKDLSREECAKELDDTEKVIAESAPRPHLFRPPGGLYDDKVIEEAEKRGYQTILWSVDPLDWKNPSVDYVVQTVMKKAQSGGIILLHDGLYPVPTPRALGQIIDLLRQKGYTFVTVDQLLKYSQVQQTGQT